VRAHDVTVDASLLWVGAGLALAVAVLLAFVPRLPSSTATNGMGLGGRSLRLTSGTNRRLRIFAITQIAASFVLVAGAGMLIATLFALQRQETGLRGSVLAVNVPVVSYERKPAEVAAFYKEAIRRISQIAGVDRVAVGTVVPWRDPGFFAAQFTAEGYKRASGEEDPRARFRTVSPGFFGALGVRMIAGREFNDSDRADGEKVVIISESVAKRMFPSLDAVDRKVMWTDPVTKFIGVSPEPRRIVGVAADIDDENLVPEPAMTVYHPLGQEMTGGRLFIHAKVDPYTLVTPVTKIIRELAGDQPVERAATLDDIRAEVLAPNRINALVFGGFAGVALLIAVVGVAGVLAFSVSARTREFGVRLAVGSTPAHLLAGVLKEGAAIGVLGIAAGAAGGVLLARVAGSFVSGVQIPGLVPIAAAAFVLIAAAVLASVTPAARASRVDVVRALRSD
jgi:predicted permease